MINDKIEELKKKTPCGKYFKVEDRICGEEYNLAEEFGENPHNIFLMRIWYCKDCVKRTFPYLKAKEEYEKEINDLKREIKRLTVYGESPTVTYEKEQTSKKVEELKKIIGKNALKRDWDYIKEIDEIFPPQNNIPQRDKKFAKKEVKK